MQIHEVIGLLPALLAGVLLGIVFFGGLWFTVRLGLGTKKTALIFTASFMVRITIILFGFYYIGANSWQKMLVCLGGFLLARIVITRITLKLDGTGTPRDTAGITHDTTGSIRVKTEAAQNRAVATQNRADATQNRAEATQTRAEATQTRAETTQNWAETTLIKEIGDET